MRPDWSASTNASVSTMGPRAAFTSSAPCGINAQVARANQPVRLRVSRQNQNDDFGLRQQAVEFADGMDLGSVRAVRATRSNSTWNGASMRSISLPMEP
jgi:hypothetical protein